jgi:peroxiredoxin
LLVNWSPECGFCDVVAPDLVRLQTDCYRDLQVLLVAHGEVEANREMAKEHDLECPILLLKGGESPVPFKSLGTPVAYLLDGEGRVAKPLAVGSEQIPALAREIARQLTGRRAAPLDNARDRPLTESRIVRDGLKAGMRAPLFRLPDIYGKDVSLEDYRGRRVLLVFSDPHCGPCDELAPRLAELQKEHRENGLAFIMVGRGELEENRRKAEQHGIRFPVVIQDKWKLSKEYGIFATPVAFLLREDGVLLKDVAIGPTAITAMAHAGLSNARGEEHEYVASR